MSLNPIKDVVGEAVVNPIKKAVMDPIKTAVGDSIAHSVTDVVTKAAEVFYQPAMQSPKRGDENLFFQAGKYDARNGGCSVKIQNDQDLGYYTAGINSEQDKMRAEDERRNAQDRIFRVVNWLAFGVGVGVVFCVVHRVFK